MRRILPRGVIARLIVYLALIGILPPLVVGIASYHVSQHIVRQEMQRHTVQLLQAQRDYLESQVDQIEGLIANVLGVEAITETVGRRDVDLDAYNQLVTQARIGYLLDGYMNVRGLVSIDIFTDDGRHYHVGDTLDVHSVDESQRDALFAAAAHDPDAILWDGIGANVNGKSRFRRVIAAARAINVFNGPEQGSRVAGLLLVSQDVNYLYDAFRSLEADMPGRLLVIDGKDRILYHRDLALIGTQVLSSLSAALSGGHGTVKRMIAGDEMLVSEVTSPRTGWRLVSVVPLKELDARSLPIWQTATLAIIACLLVIAVASLSLSRSVVVPLRRISHGFHELQRGHVASLRPLPTAGHDEVGDLTMWFNTFLESWGARERSEAALRESETRFRILHEASFTGLCVHYEGILLDANQALCREFGRDYEGIIGARLSDLLAPDTPTETLNRLVRGEANGMDVEAVRADGSRFPAELSSRTMPFRGKAAHVVDVRNIEARKRAETDLGRLKNEAEEANRAKSQFLAAMSHEIRTPMNAVLGLAYLLQSRPLGPAEDDMVRKISNAGRSLLGIINDILDFSKIEAGRLELEHAPFRLGDVLDNVASIMSSAVGTKTIELIVGSVPIGAMFLKGDALRLEQVLINLATNAIKFTEVGEVALTVRLADTRPGQLDLRFAVRDTGIGIPPEKQEEIFSAFSQADDTTTRRFGGTGLGLTISRRIVALMGGSISLASAPGKGSEFSFVVPLAVDEQGAVLPPPSLAGLRVLIADDHPVARDMLAEVARSMGWSTAVTSSGDGAVAQALAATAAGTPFDVLLLDWQMPGTDGLTAAARLRAALGEHQPPAIIMVTAHNKEHLLSHVLAGVVDAVLSKPVTASAMYNGVGQARRKLAGQREESVGRRDGRRLAGLTILVVDDSDINREVARQILENEAARVLLAADGKQAVETLAAAPQGAHIVLMDVQMPIMDGYEATRQIRETLHLADLPVVALSAGVFKDQQAAALKAGMNGFLPKPFDVEDLIAAVLKLTGRPPAAVAAERAEAPSPIDAERGLRNWGDGAVFKKYLCRFVEKHSQDGHGIAQLLTQGRREDAAAILHKLKGAAGSMALTAVWRQAETLERTLHEADDGETQVRDLQEALEAARSAIATYCLDKQTPMEAAPYETSTTGLFDELLRALDRDNPDAAEPILNGLLGRVPADRLAAMRERLEAFDFRGTEALARAFDAA